MIERLRSANKSVKDLGVKQAPFVVLIGAAMPSVLAEVSFVTNSQDAKHLRSSAYRQRIAEALLNAVRKYQTSLKSVTTVAHQSPFAFRPNEKAALGHDLIARLHSRDDFDLLA